MTRVIVNGTFDILHPGHISLLEYAKSCGDYLTVAIDTDRRVRELKGPSRPINSQHDRKIMLAALRAVDNVEVFDTDQELRSIVSRHDLMVKGSDYQNKPVIGSDLVDVLFLEVVDGYSTTNKIHDIVNR